MLLKECHTLATYRHLSRYLAYSATARIAIIKPSNCLRTILENQFCLFVVLRITLISIEHEKAFRLYLDNAVNIAGRQCVGTPQDQSLMFVDHSYFKILSNVALVDTKRGDVAYVDAANLVLRMSHAAHSQLHIVVTLH